MEQREKSSPWIDEEFAEARSRVFLAALELHRAVLTNAPKLLRRSLWAVIDVVNGDAPADLPAATVLAAWQMLFLVVPVVSTTFASMSRMFAALGRETLGWVFIDEAGQAAPQAAVGALWRAQRAVVVGDPLQLEPVVTLPWSGQKRLCRQFGVDGQWAPQNASVQTVADRLNVFGTWLPEPDGFGQTWVGSPLRVHRRCERLMFDISNEIAYDNMMVYGVSFKEEFTLLARSTWLDVQAQPSGSKWNRLEGSYARATLGTIRDRIDEQMNAELAEATMKLPAWSMTDSDREAEFNRRLREAVFVVSPFRDVVRELQGMLGKVLPSNWNRVGTVHTTQGKEADIVLLVLGTATDQRQSRDWAAHPPNLLNVAVTRARRRLVVIGDYENWEQHRNFQVLAQRSTRVDAVKEWGLSRS
jgi:superfamily I DNA and/or RNA helicase